MRSFIWTSGIAGTFLLMWAEKCFVPLVRNIDEEAPVTDVVKVTRRPRIFWVGVSFHARHTWFSEVVGALDDCGSGLYSRVFSGWGRIPAGRH